MFCYVVVHLIEDDVDRKCGPEMWTGDVDRRCGPDVLPSGVFVLQLIRENTLNITQKNKSARLKDVSEVTKTEIVIM